MDVKKLWAALQARKKYWLLAMLIAVVVVAAIIVLSDSSPLMPFFISPGVSEFWR